ILNFGSQGILSKELATINIDVPIDFDEEQLKYSGPDEAKLTAIFEELEFRTIMKRVLGQKDTVPGPSNTSGQMSMFDASPAKTSPTTTKEIVKEPEVAAPAQPKDTIHTTVHDYHLIDTPELRQSL